MNVRRYTTSFGMFLFFVMPFSTTYELHDYGFGGGGVSISSSSSYSISGMAGEPTAATNATSTNYDIGAGLMFTQQSNVPAAPTFTNPASHYNKLKFVLDTGSNPTDTLFAIAISNDSFATMLYVQADGTIGASPVYQTYTNWGGAGGAFVTGLTPSTTYQMKVRAVQTKYTESGFSAVATAATVTPSVSYDIDVSAADTETGPPYIVSFGTLAVGSVTTPSTKVWVDLDTNAEQGAFVYVYSSGTGLVSANSAHTISSATGDLSSLSEGFGLQVATVGQSAGGPLAAVSPYNGGSQNVGILDTSTRTIFNSTSAPITAGRGSVFLKAKAATTTPAASDYSTIITMIASATF